MQVNATAMIWSGRAPTRKIISMGNPHCRWICAPARRPHLQVRSVRELWGQRARAICRRASTTKPGSPGCRPFSPFFRKIRRGGDTHRICHSYGATQHNVVELKFNRPRGEMVAVSRHGQGLMLREFPRRKKRKATVGFYACYRGPGDSIWGPGDVSAHIGEGPQRQFTQIGLAAG